MSNGLPFDFDSLTWLLPGTLVDHQTNQDDPPPSLQPRYRAFITTTRRSATVRRIGTLPLTVPAAWVLPSTGRSNTRPASSARQLPEFHTGAQAELTPPSCRTATWPGMQDPTRLVPGQQLDPGFGHHRYAYDTSSVVYSRSSSRLTPDTSRVPFPQAPHHGSLPQQVTVVCDLPLRGRSRRANLHHQCSTASGFSVFYIGASFSALGAPSSANRSNQTVGYSRAIHMSKP